MNWALNEIGNPQFLNFMAWKIKMCSLNCVVYAIAEFEKGVGT